MRAVVAVLLFLGFCGFATAGYNLIESEFECTDFLEDFETGVSGGPATDDLEETFPGWTVYPSRDPNEVAPELVDEFAPASVNNSGWVIASPIGYVKRGFTMGDKAATSITWFLDDELEAQNHTLASPAIHRRRNCMDCSLFVGVLAGGSTFNRDSDMFQILYGTEPAIENMTILAVPDINNVGDLDFSFPSVGAQNYYFAFRTISENATFIQIDHVEVRCGACSSNAFWDGSDCICEGEGEYISDECACPAAEGVNGTADYFPYPSGGCFCQDGIRTYNSATGCQCIDGAEWMNEECMCPNGESYIPEVGCMCVGGATLSSGECVCAGGAVYDSNEGCVCQENAVYTFAGCRCYFNGIYDADEGCTCGGGAEFSIAQGCVCQDDRTYNSTVNECSCLSGSTFNEETGKCDCISDEEEGIFAIYNIGFGCSCQSRGYTYEEETGCELIVENEADSAGSSLGVWF